MAQAGELFLGLDIGTTKICAIVGERVAGRVVQPDVAVDGGDPHHVGVGRGADQHDGVVVSRVAVDQDPGLSLGHAGDRSGAQFGDG